MRFVMSVFIAVMMVCSMLSAQMPNGLDERAIEETNRRGSDVEPLGVIQAGPDAAIRKAFAPPADDSDKWWVNVITAGANASDKEKAASKLLVDDIKALKFKDYVKPEDSASSWSHYQERREDDPLQQDWLAPIRPKLKEVGLPAVVIQPPRNGKFGPNNRTVCVVGQYDGRPSVFAALIQQRVESYIHKHAFDGSIAAAAMPPAGHRQSDASIGAKPPFDLPEPIAYPDAKDLPRSTLTYEQIRKKFPDIEPEDAGHYAELQMTEHEIQEAEAKVYKTPENPTQGAGGSVLGEILLAVTVIGIAFGIVLYTQQRKKNQVEPTASTIATSGS